MPNGYVCAECGHTTDNPHFDLVSGVVRCPLCLEKENGLLSRLRGVETKNSDTYPD
ncbi:MAG: hypothetical protein GX316_00950 [Firmicutes bacterium]|nr:hypothetical protein [Bacillota bacterium]